jgi:hypothetical protein
MDEAVEQEEEVIIENIEPEKEPEPEPEPEKEIAAKEKDQEETPQIVPSISNMDNDPVVTKLTFNDYDSVLDMGTGRASDVNAPKSIDRLEEISTARAIQRKLEEEEDDDEDRIKIHTDSIDLGEMDVFDMNKTSSVGDTITLDGIEEL